MALIEHNLFGTVNKVETAIMRLKTFETEEGYFLAFGGGKDSTVVLELAKRAGVKYEPHFHITTLDPPEVIKFIKRHHPEVIRDRPEMNMWQLMKKKMMPPTRRNRYCCEVLKEVHGKGRCTLTGVRWEESQKRAETQGIISVAHKDKDKRLILNEDNDDNRRMVEQCYRTSKVLVNPIIDWTEEDVWEFIKGEGIPYCELYDEGFRRVGCVGCPLAGKARYREFARWPNFERLYRKTFDEIVELRKETGRDVERPINNWDTGEHMFRWWMQEEEFDDGGLFDDEEGI